MKLLNARQKMVTLAVASALAGGGAALTSAPAHAINVSQNNLGQVLLYPYYTTRNGYDTLISVVNTSDRTVAFKIRFREALNSREVRDFNVILSPYDVWNGAVTSDGAGGALFRTFDKSCTSPLLPASATVAGATEIGFTNAAYTGEALDATDPAYPFHIDGGGTGIDRVREGYIEVISMFSSTLDTGSTSAQSTNVVEYNAKHVNGVPRDCAAVDAAIGTATAIGNLSYKSLWTAPQNVLKGHSTFIDVATGKALDAEPTALENWVTDSWTVSRNFFAGGDLAPNLQQGNDAGSLDGVQLRWFDNGLLGNISAAANSMGGVAIVDHVSAILMAKNVINQYATGTGVLTDWIVTFPTKHFYTDNRAATGAQARNFTAALPPFSESFDYDTSGGSSSTITIPYNPRGQSCDTISMKHWDREEKTSTSGSQFSPITPTSDKLCYEVNVITFNGSNLFGTAVNHKNVDTTGSGTAGWSRLTFANTGVLTDPAPATFTGLPVIGFAATVRNNASEAGNNRNYASSEEHAYTGGKPNVDPDGLNPI